MLSTRLLRFADPSYLQRRMYWVISASGKPYARCRRTHAFSVWILCCTVALWSSLGVQHKLYSELKIVWYALEYELAHDRNHTSKVETQGLSLVDLSGIPGTYLETISKNRTE